MSFSFALARIFQPIKARQAQHSHSMSVCRHAECLKKSPSPSGLLYFALMLRYKALA